MSQFEPGDVGMMIMATTFVMLQTPAMGIAQAGLIRRKNALSMIMQVLSGLVIGSLLWYVIGFSLTFGPSLFGIIGSPQWALLIDIDVNDCMPNGLGDTIPVSVFFAFQMMFALMTPVSAFDCLLLLYSLLCLFCVPSHPPPPFSLSPSRLGSVG